MQKSIKNYFKFFLGLLFCLLVRLMPFRVPNIEPILATVMPFGRRYGALVGFTFAVLSILTYDIITSTWGVHTFFTAGAYGVLGFWAGSYFQNRPATRGNFVRFAIVGTLFFDVTTGLLVGPLFYGQSFAGALVGQIPFTALHLLGNVVLAATLSPAIYHMLIRKRKRSPAFIIRPLNPKTI